jgi:CRISPR type IV-associated DEAD/DEAH-box helicase Csf4
MATTLKGIDANGPGYGALVIRYSPVRRWPSVIIGHTNLASAFHDLWGRVHGALLTSGTLSLIDGLGNPTFAHAVHTLSLPADRVQVLEPAIPEWLLSTPTIWLPDASVAASFVPPQDVEAESGDEDPAYVDAIARRLRAIHASAQGGVLVLLTSYRMIWALQSALTDMGEDLITQSNTIGVEALKRSFVSARRQGRKPMWLGTGPAWTGLDLRDELAASGAEDLLLTDLVIPRVPMPRPETLPAIWRAQRIGFDAIRIEGTFLFRQGLGRLVRRDGLSHRRIWVLDGRLVPHNGASTRWVYVYDLVRRELARYPKRERYV